MSFYPLSAFTQSFTNNLIHFNTIPSSTQARNEMNDERKKKMLNRFSIELRRVERGREKVRWHGNEIEPLKGSTSIKCWVLERIYAVLGSDKVPKFLLQKRHALYTSTPHGKVR